MFQFKILNDILFTNSRLAKIGLLQSDLCTFCNTGAETNDHLFFYCVYSRAFWEEFESYWISIAKDQRKLELKAILVDVTDTKCPLFNHSIVLGKLPLWNCRRSNSLIYIYILKSFFKKNFKKKRTVQSQGWCHYTLHFVMCTWSL